MSRRNSSSQKSTSKTHTVAGLFAGIGGIEKGLHQAGHLATLLCENDSGATEVLRARFPKIPLCGDVCALESLPRDTTLIAAGFPCQDQCPARDFCQERRCDSGRAGVRRRGVPRWGRLAHRAVAADRSGRSGCVAGRPAFAGAGRRGAGRVTADLLQPGVACPAWSDPWLYARAARFVSTTPAGLSALQ